MAFKQKTGSPFQRNFGVGSSPAKQASPMKMDKPGHEDQVDPNYEKPGPTQPKPREAPLPMKSSGFKMKSGSPMKRNFGIGNTPSPMKSTGIRPVLPDGSYGEHISSTKAKEIVAKGGKVIKDGMDEVIANQAELEQNLADPNEGNYANVGQNLQDQLDVAGDNHEKVFIQDDEGTVVDSSFSPRTVHQETTVGEGSDYQNEFVKLMGPELAAADIEIQAYIEKHGSSEGMPENLLEAQKQLTTKANDMRVSTEDAENTNVKYEGEGLFDYGRVESKKGEGKDGDYGFASNIQKPHSFQDIELSPDGTAQASGTEKGIEDKRLAAIEEKKRLELEASDKIASDKLASEKKESQMGSWKEWKSNNPYPEDTFKSNKRGRSNYRDAINAYESKQSQAESKIFEL